MSSSLSIVEISLKCNEQLLILYVEVGIHYCFNRETLNPSPLPAMIQADWVQKF